MNKISCSLYNVCKEMYVSTVLHSISGITNASFVKIRLGTVCIIRLRINNIIDMWCGQTNTVLVIKLLNFFETQFPRRCDQQTTHKYYAPFIKIRLANIWVIRLRRGCGKSVIYCENQATHRVWLSGYALIRAVYGDQATYRWGNQSTRSCCGNKKNQATLYLPL